MGCRVKGAGFALEGRPKVRKPVYRLQYEMVGSAQGKLQPAWFVGGGRFWPSFPHMPDACLSDGAHAPSSASLRPYQSVEQLLRDKADCLAHPDAIVTSVGTRLHCFLGGTWREDETWTASLDEGWSVDAVLGAVHKSIAEVRR